MTYEGILRESIDRLDGPLHDDELRRCDEACEPLRRWLEQSGYDDEVIVERVYITAKGTVYADWNYITWIASERVGENFRRFADALRAFGTEVEDQAEWGKR